MVRTPLDLLLVTDDPANEVEAELEGLGAFVSSVSFNYAEDAMRAGLRVADAVVLDGRWAPALLTRSDSMPLMRAVNAAQAIRALPSYVAMPTGTKWSSIPLIILVPDELSAEALRNDRRLRFINAYATTPIENWYYDYVDPWPNIYEGIARAVDENVLTRLEEMQRLGHTFIEISPGILIRRAPPDLRRRHGTLPEIETASYYGASDTMLRKRLRDLERWSARDVVRWESNSIERALYEYEHLYETSQSEQDMQGFFSRHRYMLGSGVHGTMEHPVFLPNEKPPTRIPDFLSRSFNDALRPQPAKIFELKRPDAKLIVRNGYVWKLAGAVQTGVEESRDYADIVHDPNNAEQVRRKLGEVPFRTEKFVIAGRASRHDLSVLQRLRARYADVHIQGYDEHHQTVVDRFAS